MEDRLERKYGELKSRIASEEKAAIAFSGGVDSVLLLYAAKEALGDRAVALTVSLCAVPERELALAREFCRRFGIRHRIEKVDEFTIQGFGENPPNRCYLCKRALFTRMRAAADEEGIAFLAEGSNVDDQGDYRPGLAALGELGIASPLKDAGFTKAEIRQMAERLGLSAWNRPSSACLASRFAYGEEITPEKLKRVEQAEAYLEDLGFTQKRVRVHKNLARVELLPEELPRLFHKGLAGKVSRRLKELGFAYVTLDLDGFQSGSMNRELESGSMNKEPENGSMNEEPENDSMNKELGT